MAVANPSKLRFWSKETPTQNCMNITSPFIAEDKVKVDNTKASVDETDSDLSIVMYSLSDISLTSSSLCSEKDDSSVGSGGVSNIEVPTVFLPPSSAHYPHTTGSPLQPIARSGLHDIPYPLSESLQSGSFTNNDSETETVKDDSSTVWFPKGPASMAWINKATEFDAVSMKEKLEEQKSYLLSSFQKTPHLPQSLRTKPKFLDIKRFKTHSLKMKERRQRLYKAAQHFISSRIFRRKLTPQRCEIQLHGFDDSVERMIIFVTLQKKFNLLLPYCFEADRITIPQFLLPRKPGETITITVNGVKSENSNHQTKFSKVLVSGACTVQSESAQLIRGELELQPHRPVHSVMRCNRAAQTGGSKLTVAERRGDHYTLSTLPVPIATDFLELCVLQTAQPFGEIFALSKSTCDLPATFSTNLQPGAYHAACVYRFSSSPVAETYAVDSAAPKLFFKTSNFHQCNIIVAGSNKADIAKTKNLAATFAEQYTSQVPTLLPCVTLLKQPNLNLEDLLKTLCNRPDSCYNKAKLAPSTRPVKEQNLFFRAVDSTNSFQSLQGYTVNEGGWMHNQSADGMRSALTTPLSAGNQAFVSLPSLSVFTPNTKLYFADHWTYYDQHHVMLVLCPKDSACHQVCRQHLCKLDPYDNPFLFRKRCYDPEPSVAVYTSVRVRVEVIFSNSTDILQLLSQCSENVYHSKVQVKAREQTGPVRLREVSL